MNVDFTVYVVIGMTAATGLAVSVAIAAYIVTSIQRDRPRDKE